MKLGAIRELVHPEDRDFVFREAEETLRGGARYDVEHRLVRPSASRVRPSQIELCGLTERFVAYVAWVFRTRGGSLSMVSLGQEWMSLSKSD
jgi:hypothetical protein